MKTLTHHQTGKRCLVEVHNNKSKKSDFLTGIIEGITSATDRDYRINVILENGASYRQCAPECVLPYWYISARSAWDTVQIGPFKSIEEAKEFCNESEYKHELIKQA